MIVVYLLIWGTWLAFGISTIWALHWAFNQGHLSDPEGAARSIFDDDEPIGEMTDFFPGDGPDGAPSTLEVNDG